jgi:hypothetical protein
MDSVVTVTAPRWVFDALIVAGQLEHDRRRTRNPEDSDSGRFEWAWRIVHHHLNISEESAHRLMIESRHAEWREHWPQRPAALIGDDGNG